MPTLYRRRDARADGRQHDYYEGRRGTRHELIVLSSCPSCASCLRVFVLAAVGTCGARAAVVDYARAIDRRAPLHPQRRRRAAAVDGELEVSVLPKSAQTSPARISA